MTESEDPKKLADELEGQADDLRDKSTGLEQEIGDVKQDWERKRADEGVPGAVPRQNDEDRDEPGDETNPEDAERGEQDNTLEGSGDDDSEEDDSEHEDSEHEDSEHDESEHDESEHDDSDGED